MSAALQPIPSQPLHRPVSVGSTSLLLRLPPSLHLTDDQFYEFCRLNRELRIERTAQGELWIMAPAGWDSSRRNLEIAIQLGLWAKRDGTGVAVDSSAGYLLPSGAGRAPDASWVRHDRLAALTAEERAKFLPLCPDFVIELRSPTDGLSALQDKMREYMDNGTQLGWLIDPLGDQVFVYRPGAPVERLEEPDSVSADPLLPGFRLELDEIL